MTSLCGHLSLNSIGSWLLLTADGCVHVADTTQLDFAVGKFVQTRRDCRQLDANSVHTAVREYVFLRFLKIPKNATFYVFLKRRFKKNVKKRNPKFEVSDFADFSLHGISNTALKQCMFIIYMALVLA